MNNKFRSISIVAVMTALVSVFSVWNILKAPEEYSLSERRALAQIPELNAESIVSGDFMDEFETYAADQFPLRDSIRSIKSFTELNIFRKSDVNGLYMQDGHIVKNEKLLDTEMLDYAGEKFRYIYDTFIANSNAKVYLSIVPDKSYYLSDGRPALDYEKLTEEMQKRTDYMTYIDISHLLEADDYYKTDSHWKQECIQDAAQALAAAMGADAGSKYHENTLDIPFYGVYYGQLGLSCQPDTIKYLTNDTLDSCYVTSYGTGSPKESVIYNMKKAEGKDPYEMFLSGTEPFITIENPAADTDRELVIFRDSYGSSLAPLLIEGYSKITLIDIRYMQSSFLGSLIEFDEQDVLFLYSASLLNSSTALR